MLSVWLSRQNRQGQTLYKHRMCRLHSAVERDCRADFDSKELCKNKLVDID